MLDLSYRLEDKRDGISQPDVFVESNEVDLRFRLALGDLVLAAPEADFSARWGWVPLIDFAASIREIVHDLTRGRAHAEFEFTESEATLSFARHGAELVLTASYAPGRIQVPLDLFAERLRRFEAELRADLVRLYPVLDSHPVFNRLLPREHRQP